MTTALALLEWSLGSKLTDAAFVAALIAVLGEAIAILVVWRLLHDGQGATSATLSWILVMLAAPYVGVALYYMWGRQLTRRRLKLRQDRLADLELPPEDAAQHPLRVQASDTEVLRLVDGIDEAAVYADNAVELLADGPEFIAAAKRTIDAAQHYVHVQTFILRPDETGLAFLSLLTEAAARGVEVRLLYDSLGSWSLKDKHLRTLHTAGGQSAAFMPILWRRRPFTINLRNHRKLLIVDGSVAFCGGRNIGDEYARDRFGPQARWLDLMVEVYGPVVPRLQRVFVEDWFTATRRNLVDSRYFTWPGLDPEQRGRAENTVAVVAGGPNTSPSRHHLVLFQLLASAREKVDISSPYLVPHPTILTALVAAAARGVRVRILTNGRRAEALILFHAKRAFYPTLLDAGVQVLETREDYNHGKMVLVDDRVLYVGSPNMDIRSEELNFELGLVIEDGDRPAAVREASMVFSQRASDAQPVASQDLSRGRVRVLFQNLCRLLAPAL